MGWVVYNRNSGRAHRYYKKESTAKAQATKMNRDPYRLHSSNEEPYAHISYAGYEGILMGLKGAELKYWDWLQPRG